MIEGIPLIEVNGLDFRVNELFTLGRIPEIPETQEHKNTDGEEEIRDPEFIKSSEDSIASMKGIKMLIDQMIIEDNLGIESATFSTTAAGDKMVDCVELEKQIKFDNDMCYEKRIKNIEESSILALSISPDTPTQEEFLKDALARSPSQEQVKEIIETLKSKEKEDRQIQKTKKSLSDLFTQTNDITQLLSIRLGEIINSKKQSKQVLDISSKMAENAKKTYEELVMGGQTYNEGEPLSMKAEGKEEGIIYKRYIVSNFASQLVEEVNIRGRPGAKYHYLPGVDDILVGKLVQTRFLPLIKDINLYNRTRYENWKKTRQKKDISEYTQDTETGKIVPGEGFYLDRPTFEDIQQTIETAPNEIVEEFYSKNPKISKFFSEFKEKFIEDLRYHTSRFERAIAHQLLDYGLKDPKMYKRPKEIKIEMTRNGVEYKEGKNGEAKAAIGEYYREPEEGEKEIKITAELLHKQQAKESNKKEPAIRKRILYPVIALAGAALLGNILQGYHIKNSIIGFQSMIQEQKELVKLKTEEGMSLTQKLEECKQYTESYTDVALRLAFKEYGLQKDPTPEHVREAMLGFMTNYDENIRNKIKDLEKLSKINIDQNTIFEAYKQTGNTALITDTALYKTRYDAACSLYISLVINGDYLKASALNRVKGPFHIPTDMLKAITQENITNPRYYEQIGINEYEKLQQYTDIQDYALMMEWLNHYKGSRIKFSKEQTERAKEDLNKAKP